MDYIKDTALEVIQFVKSKGLEVRFSSEDSFRSDLVDLLNIYTAVDKIGVTRVRIPFLKLMNWDANVWCLIRWESQTRSALPTLAKFVSLPHDSIPPIFSALLTLYFVHRRSD